MLEETNKPPEMNTSTQPAAEHGIGTVVAIGGPVVDVQFPHGQLPSLRNDLSIEWDGSHRLVAEVQSHLDDVTVRSVALQETSGLRCGTLVRDFGGSIEVPAGDAMLGRMVDVLGDPIDHDSCCPLTSVR